MGKVLRLYPGPPEELAEEDVYTDLALPKLASEGRAEMPHVVINMVSTLDGKTSVGGKASPIGSHVDRLLMRNIRGAVDAVLVGAGTVRAEEMNLSVPEEVSRRRKENGLSDQPLGVILAGSGTLPLERNVFHPDSPSQGQSLVVISGDNTPEMTLREAHALGACILRAEGAALPEPRKVLLLLRDHLNVRTVLLEGGPSINGSFLSSGIVDEIFLTLSPKIFFSHGDSLTLVSTHKAEHPATHLDLASTYLSAHEGELYLRYIRRNS